MKTFGVFAVLVLSLATVSFADTLTNVQPASCANASDCTVSGVNLTSSVTATIEGRTSQLKLVGAGLRAKKIVVVPVNVYVAQFYATDPSKIVRTLDGIFPSLDSQDAVAMTLTFRRDVTAEQIQTAFQDAFDANGIDMTSGQIANFLDHALKTGVAKDGKVMTFVGEKLADGTTAVTFESTQGNPVTFHGDKDFIRQVMSLWLGAPADGGLENLKKDLLRNRSVK